METLINTVKEWPVIIQGALGSGLFWIILLIGQKTVIYCSKKYSHKSKQDRISWLTSGQFKYATVLADGHAAKAHCFAVIIYRSLRPFYRAAMWMTLGLITNSFIQPLGIVGFIGTLYYLFKAFEVVAPIEDIDDIEKATKRFNEFSEEIENLKKNNKAN